MYCTQIKLGTITSGGGVAMATNGETWEVHDGEWARGRLVVHKLRVWVGGWLAALSCIPDGDVCVCGRLSGLQRRVFLHRSAQP